MADIEKVIKGLEQFTLWIKNGHKICLDNPNDFWAELYEMGEDALELLKEQQEEVEPHHKCIGETYSLITESHIKYCPWCGRKVKRISD